MGNLIDMTGQQFCRLVVVERVRIKEKESKQHTSFWKCKCDCGGEIICSRTHLLDGHIQSCGCLHDENAKISNRTHGKYHTRIHAVWSNMIQRCTNPNNHKYHRYGARGINVCDEWRLFENFYNWSIENGYDETLSAKECSIDRIDNDKGYYPENCRWTTSVVQSGNKSDNIYLTYNGVTKSCPEWERITGISCGVLTSRKRRGWNDEKCLTIPLKQTKKKVICENKIFKTIKECAKYYQINEQTLNGWLKNRHRMPEKFKKMGLDYYKEPANEE